MQAKQRLSYPALESHEDLRYQEMLILLQGLAPKVGTPWVLKALVFLICRHMRQATNPWHGWMKLGESQASV